MRSILQSLLLYFRPSVAAVRIPASNGTYGIGTAVMALTDYSRLDPFAPKTEFRSVVISAFYPVRIRDECNWKLSPYMPDGTAAVYDQEYAQYGVPKGTFESFKLELCSLFSPSGHEAHDSHETWNDESFPLVLFSPGLGNSRLLYSALAQSVASHGYTVVTIDHPYDADVVEYPDGKLVKSSINNLTEALILLDLETRVEDVSFVLDELSKSYVSERLLPSFYSKWGLNSKRAAIYGHSLGGATAASAVANDSRLIGSINLDGELFGSVTKHGLDAPFILFGHDTNVTMPSWEQIWPHLDSWKLQLLLEESEHGTFSDLPLLAQLLGYDPLPPQLAGLLGTLSGTRGREIISTYVAAFMDMVFKGEPSVLLDGPSGLYPEVVFVRD